MHNLPPPLSTPSASSFGALSVAWSATRYGWIYRGRSLGVTASAETVVGCSGRSSLNGVAEEPREGCTNRCSEWRRRKEKLGGVAALLDDIERRGWGLGWVCGVARLMPIGDNIKPRGTCNRSPLNHCLPPPSHMFAPPALRLCYPPRFSIVARK
ncbi:hypothetical protein FA15DRAFT_124345 [Coprinopsis marcescibilis]|uniref:Uncharacterized protein n=1 Tax=Coprinopsis marcescibilis TaxID=230819 RepID=A0A5C3KJX5_COPMA|nr:hypothetical protein FA15DRAFT_124345 [Coprinopsis marcescibilis]